MVANLLLMLEIYQTEYSPMIVQHPFTSTGIVMNPHIGISEMLNIAQNESDLNMWREQMKKEIDAAQKPFEIYMMLNKPYCLTFLKYAMPHLSKEDFSVMLADAWIRSENPNMDRNLNKAALLDMFQQADPAELMEENERKELEEMDEVITIYRGVTSFNAKKIRSLSWTTEYSIAQTESENISANVKWGKAQSAKEGKAPFFYKKFIGFKKGEDGKPQIDEEQAKIVKFIYDRFLAGDSIKTIAQRLDELKILSPAGKEKWSCSTIHSILTNEKYKGDLIINKTYVVDCISKKVKVNRGERTKYYVENNHPAIIDAATFGRVQEELARRASKQKIKQVGTKTELGRYSGKYALSELLICGECKSHYRRCTWTIHGKKKIVWRCISRLDYGKKYCHHSPSVEESVLQDAIMNAILRTANQNAEVLNTLKLHLSMAIGGENKGDESVDLKIRINEIDTEINAMIKAVSAETVDSFDEQRAADLLNEKNLLQQQLAQIMDTKQKRENAKSRLEELYDVIDSLKNHPLTYDNQLVRQLLEGVIVESQEEIRVVFIGGLEVVESINSGNFFDKTLDRSSQICYN